MIRRWWPLLAVLALSGCDVALPTGSPLVVLTPDTVKSPGDVPSGEAGIRPVVERQATRFGLEPSLVMGLIKQESGFQASVISAAGAQGLMQLMPITVEQINTVGVVTVLDPFDVEQNVAGGCWYLKWVHAQLPDARIAAGEDWKLTLAGYNAGPTRVANAILKALAGAPAHPRARWQDVLPLLPAETQAYVPAVLANQALYR